MKSKLLHDENGLKTFALVFDKDDEVKESLLRFATENGLRAEDVDGSGLSVKSRLASLTEKRRAIRKFR